MSNAPARPKNLITPPGIAIWPRLTSPSTTYKPEGVYEIKQKFPEDADEATMIESLQAEYDAGYAAALKEVQKKAPKTKELKKQDVPWKPELDADGEPTGKMVFKFSMTASGVSKKTGKPWTRRPGLFDAAGKCLNGDADLVVSGGSTVIVSYTVGRYYTAALGFGIKLYLEGVQILNLVSYSGAQDAQQYGFGKEAGYSGAVAAPTANEGAEDGDPGSDDF